MTKEDSKTPFTETEEFLFDMAHAMQFSTDPKDVEQIGDALLSIAETDMVRNKEDKANPQSATRYELKQFPGSIVRVKTLNGGWLLQSIEGGGAPRDVSVACNLEEAWRHLWVALAYIKLRKTSKREEAQPMKAN